MTQFQITIPHKKPDQKRQNDNKKKIMLTYIKSISLL